MFSNKVEDRLLNKARQSAKAALAVITSTNNP